jgi:replicative superfamily II helicase
LKNPNFYDLDGNENHVIKKFLNDTVTKIFKELKDSGCIEVHENEDGETFVMPTDLGFIASSYYLKNLTVKKFTENMTENMEYPTLLRLMSDAEEFKETPLRHNEDVHNK